MAGSFFARLKALLRGGERKDHVSVLVPFLIICAGLGVLAWRSYQLSVRMELGAKALAGQYASYVAEITARRVDAAIRNEMFRASDDWQHVERRTPEPTFTALQEWINTHDWIVSAIYVPDADPASSIFVSELAPKAAGSGARLRREFFTSSGNVTYMYDPALLFNRVRADVQQQPLIRGSGDGGPIVQQQADVALLSPIRQQGLRSTPTGFAYVAPLAAPLEKFGIQATVHTAYLGSGWQNHRIVSLLLSLLALLLMGAGAALALRGIRKESETMKLRGALIANVSHELRTPLAMIRLGAETLKRGAQLKEKERDDIQDTILREVLHLSHLVENVLDVARIQHRNAKALAFTPVYPSDLVEELVATYESWIHSKGFEVSMEIDDEIEEQMWDREAVSRALLNLIDNAIKYSLGEQAIHVELYQTDEHVVLGVRDHGVGIAARDLTKIFDPYYRAQFSDTQTRRGAGLGLTLVEQIVASHGGRVEVESEVGTGSTFRLLFPRGSADEADRADNVIRTSEAF
jgi:signal transduction histidine kinase